MSATEQIINGLMNVVSQKDKKVTTPYDTAGTVTRVEGDTVWVHFVGGVDETPVQLTIAAKEGDTVQVRVGGGTAWLVGNQSAPPTDDKAANDAHKAADDAAGAAYKAHLAADEAMSAAARAAEQMATAVIQINSDIADLQSQIDGNVTSWFFDYDPTLSNYPASEWIAEGTESVHLGDTFYNTDNGYAYRWMSDGATPPTYSWQRISDTDVTQALAMAAAAQDTADSKRRVFVTTPTPPYDVGDLWFAGNSGDILTCTTAKDESGTYSATDFTKLNKYTDDTRAEQAYSYAGQAATAAAAAQSSANDAATAAANAQTSANAAATAASNAQDSADDAMTAAQDAQDSADDAATAAGNAMTEAQAAHTAANNAQTSANNAATAAGNAQTSADNAATAASRAQARADSAVTAASTAQAAANAAQTSADNAQESADKAQVSANNAGGYAAQALGNLSTVQSVAETLQWVTDHGTMTLTTDTAIDPTHVYFTQDADGDYVVGGVHYSVVVEPVAADLSTYYVLSIDESLQNYVGTHLAVTDEGLWILPAATGFKVLIATGNGTGYPVAGTYIIDATGATIARFAADTQIGKTGGHKLIVNERSLELDDENGTKRLFAGKPSARLTHVREAFTTSVATVKRPTYTVDVSSGVTATTLEGTACTVSDITTNSFIITGAESAAYIADYYTPDAIYSYSLGNGTQTVYSNNAVSESNGQAYGVNAHAENNAIAMGKNSHAQGDGTIAVAECQTVIGMYNDTSFYEVEIPDSGGGVTRGWLPFAFVIGNGNAALNRRTNAFAVDWNGGVRMALNTAAREGYEDHDLYAAITALGWESEVIV